MRARARGIRARHLRHGTRTFRNRRARIHSPAGPLLASRGKGAALHLRKRTLRNQGARRRRPSRGVAHPGGPPVQGMRRRNDRQRHSKRKDGNGETAIVRKYDVYRQNNVIMRISGRKLCQAPFPETDRTDHAGLEETGRIPGPGRLLNGCLGINLYDFYISILDNRFLLIYNIRHFSFTANCLII